MLRLYEILKTSKTKVAPDLWTRLAAEKMAGDSEKVRELTGELPLTFTANGQPLLDYTIYGNMEQAGTPTPTAPIQPSECEERTKNLFDKDNAVITHLYPLQDGTTFTQGSEKMWSIILPCKPNTTYTLSKSILSHSTPRHRVSGSEEYPTAGGAQTFIDDKSETISGDTRSRQIFTTTENTHWIVCFLYSNNIYEELIEQLQSLQLEEANDKTEYEPYGYKIPISSANTTTPVYLGEVESTRRIKKLVLTGGDDENWSSTTIETNDYIYRIELSDLPKSGVAPICTHYTGSTVTRWVDIENYGVTTSIINSVAIRHSGLTGVSDWKAYLQQQYANGTPVTVWYVLANEETGIDNEPLRKIGDYADTLSMEQAGVQILTNRGSTVIDVDTTLKPSEMYIKYQE